MLKCPMLDHWPTRDGLDRMPPWALGDALYAVHFPILVQHTGGENSAVRLAGGRCLGTNVPDPHVGARTSPYFVGAGFDALALGPRDACPTRH
jgi:hypothetical protein